MKNNINLANILIIAGLAVYVLSPVDIAPGPIDDVVISLIGLAAARANTMRLKKAQQPVTFDDPDGQDNTF